MTHPLTMIVSCFKDRTLELVRYSPSSYDVVSQKFSVFRLASELSLGFLDEAEKFLRPNEELGISSLVKGPYGDLHIPMVDFSTSSEKKAWEAAKSWLPCEPYLYNSGNSFHAYWSTLISKSEWESLLSKMKKNSTVDRTWCDLRRQDDGKGLLRWTANNKRTRPFLVRGPSSGGLSLAESVRGELTLPELKKPILKRFAKLEMDP